MTNARQFCVTGASRGIGLAAARAATRAGYQVYGTARYPERCETCTPFAMERVDMADHQQVCRWLDGIPPAPAADVRFLVNHSILGPKRPLAEVSYSEFAETLRINSLGVFSVIQQLARQDRLPRALCVVTSSVGRHGRATWGPYSASKFVVESLVQTLADEVDSSACVVFAFNPGGTATRMRQEAYPDEDPATLPTAEQVGGMLFSLLDAADTGLHGESINYRDLL